jgi:hypothetical protein
MFNMQQIDVILTPLFSAVALCLRNGWQSCKRPLIIECGDEIGSVVFLYHLSEARERKKLFLKSLLASVWFENRFGPHHIRGAFEQSNNYGKKNETKNLKQ